MQAKIDDIKKVLGSAKE